MRQATLQTCPSVRTLKRPRFTTYCHATECQWPSIPRHIYNTPAGLPILVLQCVRNCRIRSESFALDPLRQQTSHQKLLPPPGVRCYFSFPPSIVNVFNSCSRSHESKPYFFTVAHYHPLLLLQGMSLALLKKTSPADNFRMRSPPQNLGHVVKGVG